MGGNFRRCDICGFWQCDIYGKDRFFRRCDSKPFLRTPDGFFFHPFLWWQGSSLILSRVEKPLCICMFVHRRKGGEGGRISNWIKFLLSPFAFPLFRGLIWLSGAISSFYLSLSLSLSAFLHFPSFPSELSFYSTLLCCHNLVIPLFFCFDPTHILFDSPLCAQLASAVGLPQRNRIKLLSRKFQKVLNRTFARLKRDEIGRTLWRPTLVRWIPPLCTFPLLTHHVLVLTPISHLLFPRKTRTDFVQIPTEKTGALAQRYI